MWSATSNAGGNRRRGLGRENIQVKRCKGSLSGGLGQACMVGSACLQRTAGSAVASVHDDAVVQQPTSADPTQQPESANTQARDRGTPRKNKPRWRLKASLQRAVSVDTHAVAAIYHSLAEHRSFLVPLQGALTMRRPRTHSLHYVFMLQIPRARRQLQSQPTHIGAPDLQKTRWCAFLFWAFEVR